MDSPRKVTLLAGSLYLLTVVTSIPALALKEPVLSDLTTLGTGGALLWAGALEVVLAAACVGTAVVLYPVVRRQSEAAALGFVAARIVEAAAIVVGVLAMLSLVTVRSGGGSADALDGADSVLLALHDWAFLLGPGTVPAVNALCLGYVLYRSRLVPRIIPLLGLVGAPLLLLSATATVAGALDQVSALAAVLALPIALWEISLGLWLVLRGFDRGALVRLMPRQLAVATA